MMRWFGVLGAAVALLGAAAPAFAAEDDAGASEDLGTDEVVLKNGGTVRGTIVSYEPGQDVVIKVYGKKQPRTIGWAEVADVERGKYKPRPKDDDDDPGPAGPGYGDDKPSEVPKEIPVDTDEQGVVVLHINSDDPDLALFEMTGSGAFAGGYGVATFSTATFICRAPCDKVIDARDGRPFRFGGDGVTDSDSFSLSEWQGHVVVDVDVGSSTARTAGVWMTILGAPFVLSGGIGMGVALSGSIDAAPVAISSVILGTGIVVTSIGIPLMVNNDTDYELRSGVTDGPRMVRGNPLSWTF
jgi:hypothetical protein